MGYKVQFDFVYRQNKKSNRRRIGNERKHIWYGYQIDK